MYIKVYKKKQVCKVDKCPELAYNRGVCRFMYTKGENRMKSDVIMTKQQADELIKHLENVFTVVRLLDAEDLKKRMEGQESDVPVPCQCYAFWNKKHPCDNCISIKALKEKNQLTKLEYIDSQIFHVISRYIEIDGKAYVMEMLSCLEDHTMMDAEGRDLLISKLTRYNEELYRDALTGVYNRRYYETYGKKMKGTIGVAMFDLDDFKLYNDTSGHNAGDVVLNTVVREIQACIRKTDILIRFVGDEFLLLMPEIEENIFAHKLRQIRKRVNAAEVPGYSWLHISVSIGGVIAKDENIDDVVARADKLMYQAKKKKNMVITENEDVDSEEENSKQTVLVVDDSEINRQMLSEMLKNDFRVLEASSGEQCVDMLQEHGGEISIILLDIIMPGMDGFDVLEYMRENHWIEEIPVIIISKDNSLASVTKAYKMGASEYIGRPFDAQVIYQRVYNVIKLYAKQRRLISLVTEQIYEKEKNERMLVDLLSQIVELRNGENGIHVRHVHILTEMLLEQLVQKTDRYNLTWSDQLVITTASALHDIGKIGISEKILNKREALTKREEELVEAHTVLGASMLKNLDSHAEDDLVKTAYEICRWHHERYDGSGYPDGLKGDEIPIAAQIVALADAYDKLIRDRVNAKGIPHEEAMKILLQERSSEFNPILLECLSEIQGRIGRAMQDGVVDIRDYNQFNNGSAYKKMIKEAEE